MTRLRGALVATLAAAGATTAWAQQSTMGEWSAPHDWAVMPIHAVLLPNGDVLGFGTDSDGVQGGEVEYGLWTPSLGTGPGAFQLLPMTAPTDLFCSAFSLDPVTGLGMTFGGDNSGPGNYGNFEIDLYSPDARLFSEAPADMIDHRWYPTVLMLPNGETLVMGGSITSSANPAKTPEVYSVLDGQRTLLGAFDSNVWAHAQQRWWYPRAWVAPDGSVFGLTGSLMYSLTEWDQLGDTDIIGSLSQPCIGATSSAVMYDVGKILQVGGGHFSASTSGDATTEAILIDINGANPQVTAAAPMALPRHWHNATVLPNGEVLVTGGARENNVHVGIAYEAEMWNPATGEWRTLAPQARPRLYHSTALLLPDGRVMSGGGGAPGPALELNAELFSPPYLFGANDQLAPRPSITSGPELVEPGTSFSVTLGSGAPIADVTLTRFGSVTHSFDMEQRFQRLGFTQSGNTLQVEAPADRNVMPPGYYLLWALDANGVPSVGHTLRVEPPHVAPPAVLGAWPLDGDSFDQVGQNHGVALGDPTFTPSLFGDQALALDGTGDGLVLHNTLGWSFSLALWMRTDAPTATGSDPTQGTPLLQSDLGSANAHDFTLSLLDGRLAYQDGLTELNVTGDTFLADGGWHHVALTRTSTGVFQLYVDGALEVDGLGAAGILGGPGWLWLGANPTTGLWLEGEARDLRQYDHALDAVTIEALADHNQPPILELGDPLQVELGQNLALDPQVLDDGRTPGPLVASWSQVSGALPAHFDAPQLPATGARFYRPGQYVLRLTVSDGEYTVEDTVTVHVHAPAVEPRVDAGPDRVAVVGSSIYLVGTMDHASPRSVDYEWFARAGSDTLSFTHPTSLRTHVTFHGPGVHKLRLTANDGSAVYRDWLTVVVHPAGAPEQQLVVPLSSGQGDAAQVAGMSVRVDDLTLELGERGAEPQVVGLRFPVQLPRGATVTSAVIRFHPAGQGAGAAELQISAEGVDNAAPLGPGYPSLESRGWRSQAAVRWFPRPWLNTGPTRATPDLSAILQEQVDRAGWNSGKHVLFFLEGSGQRRVDAYEADPARAPQLEITWH